jgi:hypothetical protein
MSSERSSENWMQETEAVARELHTILAARRLTGAEVLYVLGWILLELEMQTINHGSEASPIAEFPGVLKSLRERRHELAQRACPHYRPREG